MPSLESASMSTPGSSTPMVADHVGRRPFALEFRSSYWFTTFVVGLGIITDLIVYSIIIPVMPFRLEHLHYHHISSLTGWLIFAYSAGLVLSTIPIALLSERYNDRKTPLIIGLLCLIGFQVMLMEAPNYAVMAIARVLQGISSSVVWVVGLALLCDSTPVAIIGRQLGIAMAGLSIGLLIGPPVGGTLYERFGFRGPFVFGLAVTVVDLIGRLIVIERREALKYGHDPAAWTPAKDPELASEKTDPEPTSAKAEIKGDAQIPSTSASAVVVGETPPPRTLTLVEVIVELTKSPRALVSLFLALTYGLVYSSQEPSIPLHLAAVWGLDSGTVGLVFLAAVIPTLFSSPITGYLADRKGPEWVSFISLSLAIPWWIVVTIQGPLLLFIVAFAIQSFFTSAIVSPLMVELAAVSREVEGIGFAHVYGAFNLVYGIGTSVGPVVGGQVYDHLRRGWATLCYFATALIIISEILAFLWIGADPLYDRLVRWMAHTSSQSPPAPPTRTPTPEISTASNSSSA
ncbi:MFS general substrate transporter [Pluteus cervinus]|uniref:MFS general substrate transporter n=1 Tax=Pluteus cervinus TaxID=181527 RepID=A0ACD3BET9_9AGAR|nr:MFS general substrate transporter [Pluteus cervinus]